VAEPQAVSTALSNALGGRERGWQFRQGDPGAPGAPGAPGGMGGDWMQKLWDGARSYYNSDAGAPFRDALTGGQPVGEEWAQWPTVQNALPDQWKTALNQWQTPFKPDRF